MDAKDTEESISTEQADKIWKAVNAYNAAPRFLYVIEYSDSEFNDLALAGRITGEVIGRTANSVWIGYNK